MRPAREGPARAQAQPSTGGVEEPRSSRGASREGGVEEELLKRVASILASGVQLVMLLALSDEGAPAYNHELAAELTALGAPAFACTPELFPDLMGAALRREDIVQWAAARGIVTTRSSG